MVIGMARFTQIIGLKHEAREFLKKRGYVCLRTPYASAKDAGMFEDGPELYEWRSNDSDIIYREVVQCAPWSSGPCIFLCLQEVPGAEVLRWTEKEIKEAM